MKKIAYLLHRFPGTTDTFIKREIRSLQRFGMNVGVVSVWKPKGPETTPEILADWSKDTHFALPQSPIAIAWILLASALRSPLRFLTTVRLALATSRPGFRGLAYQAIYFVEAVLAADILRRNDFTHAHNHIGDHSGTVTMLAAKLAGIGYSITFHGWPVFFDIRYWRVKEKVLGAQFTRSISYFCRSQLMMFSGLDDPTQFKVVHCGLDLDKYEYRVPRQEVKTLFCVARLSSEKGLSFLVRGLKVLRDKGYDLDLRLAGDGPTRQPLEQLARDLRISDHVKFLGYINEDNVVRELSNADIFVLPSYVEGLPVSAMEAMAVGLPVIATNIAGTSELVEHGKSGLLIRPSDPQAIADAVVRLIDDYDFRKRAAELGRAKVVEEFEIDRETAKLRDYLLETSSPTH